MRFRMPRFISSCLQVPTTVLLVPVVFGLFGIQPAEAMLYRPGFWGYLSANSWRRSEQHPDGLDHRSTGMLESADGIRWTAISPPVFERDDTPEMGNVEVGAVREFRGRYYMLVQTWGP